MKVRISKIHNYKKGKQQFDNHVLSYSYDI